MSTFAPITRRIRHAQRYLEILEVLARYGFADIVQELRLETLIERGRSVLGAKPRPEFDHLTRAERVRKAFEQLGPTFIKLGQVLSTRPDLIPEDWAVEFTKLQHDVPGVSYEVVRARLDVEFGGRLKKIFRAISKKPLAAASMAQAHRARLRDGTRVVIKVLRPGIREVTATDMEILAALAEVAEAHFSNLGYSPTEVVKEFAKELVKEVDLTHEGRATDKLRTFFEDDENIVFPKVYWQATTQNILTIDEIRGVLLSTLKHGQIPPEERRLVVQNGARAVLRQCLELGYFHADPHPGNLFALPGGAIAFIDCGMVGQLDARTARQLADLVSGVATGDVESVIGVVAAFADAGAEKLDDRAFRSDVQSIVSQFENTPLERLNLGPVLQEFFSKLRQHKIRCPADLVLLIKALTTIETVARQLDPEFDMVAFARPYVERMVERRYSFAAVKTRFRRSFAQYAELAEDLPGEIRPLLGLLRRNKLAVNIEHHGLDRLTSTVEHASRNIAFALFVSSMLVGSSILMLAARSPSLGALTGLGVGGFCAAAVLAILMVISNRRTRS